MSKYSTLLFSIIFSVVIIFSGYNLSTSYTLPINVQYQDLSKPAQRQVNCLAENILFEAGHEGKDGQIAVAMVTLNRVVSGNYADDICGVVKQKTAGTCQFSWVCQNVDMSRVRSQLYKDVQQLATYVIMNYGEIEDETKGATYYHANYVSPGWNLPRTTQIGQHIFYRSNRDVVQQKEFKL